jgi:hypothetical protein
MKSEKDPSNGLRLTEHLVSILNVLSERGARDEPYRYRLRKDLPNSTRLFIERARTVWRQEFSDGAVEVTPAQKSVVRIDVSDANTITQLRYAGGQDDRGPTRVEIPYTPKHYRSVPFSIGRNGRAVGGSNVLHMEILKWLDDPENLTGRWSYEQGYTGGDLLFDEEADAALFNLRWR